MKIFGARVKMLRMHRSWSMRELGEKIGEITGTPVSQTAISNWEHKGAEPPYSVLVALTKLFNISTDFLLGLSNEIPESENLLINKEALIVPEKIKTPLFKTNLETDIGASIMNDLVEEIRTLPANQQEDIQNEINDYLEYTKYKQAKLYSDLKKFKKYLQYEIKASK
ncbi:transcriptional regulator (plasmid) [Bacillus cereus]|uniref:helix-turn-helix domain-containing protein n=1 Tax=Bacillus TaxID=1386 RepID=UPI000C2CFDEF|nr:helix-turn-helix transcriptional regulator [Bacillus cereus]AUB67250.1 transcriptional regulator [Bacillus cereus]